MTVQQTTLLLALLVAAVHVVLVTVVLLWVGARWFDGPRRALAWVRFQLAPSALGLATLVAVVAVTGSLYLSEVAHYPPCELCWFQRIAMYPLVPLLVLALWRRDRTVLATVWPLPALGSLVSIYHYQLERFPDQSSLSCSADVPCSVVWVWELHYVSVPLMALTGFVAIGALLALARAGVRTGTDSGRSENDG